MLNLGGFKSMTCRETVKDFAISALNLEVLKSFFKKGFKSINCRETVKDFVTSEQEFHFLNNVKGIPAYWESF